jgi:hypothetical protein
VVCSALIQWICQNRPDYKKGRFFNSKGEKLKYKEKLKTQKKQKVINWARVQALKQRYPSISHKAERMRDELKRPTRSDLPQESWQISGQN